MIQALAEMGGRGKLEIERRAYKFCSAKFLEAYYNVYNLKIL